MTDPAPAGFECGQDQLVAASKMAAAELEVSRDFGVDWADRQIGSLLQAISDKLLRYWQGRVLGIARFLASAAAFNGATYDGALPRRDGWGLTGTSSRAHLWPAYRDVADSPSGSHLLAPRTRSWSMKLTGTLAEMPMKCRLVGSRDPASDPSAGPCAA